MNDTLRKSPHRWDIIRDICLRLSKDDKENIKRSDSRIKGGIWE